MLQIPTAASVRLARMRTGRGMVLRRGRSLVSPLVFGLWVLLAMSLPPLVVFRCIVRSFFVPPCFDVGPDFLACFCFCYRKVECPHEWIADG